MFEGKREISVGTPDNTRGEDVRPQFHKRRKANLNETRSSKLKQGAVHDKGDNTMAKVKTENTEKPEVKEETVKEPEIIKVTVISRANFPITLTYNNDEIILSPRQRLVINDKAKLKIKPEDAKHIRLV